jgi:hypothetical protein
MQQILWVFDTSFKTTQIHAVLHLRNLSYLWTKKAKSPHLTGFFEGFYYFNVWLITASFLMPH